MCPRAKSLELSTHTQHRINPRNPEPPNLKMVDSENWLGQQPAYAHIRRRVEEIETQRDQVC